MKLPRTIEVSEPRQNGHTTTTSSLMLQMTKAPSLLSWISCYTKIPITLPSHPTLSRKYPPVKPCAVDPIPANLFNKCMSELLSPITTIINLFPQSGTVPTWLKATHWPIFRKKKLDSDTLNNYRPIFNLTYLSRIVELAVAKQLTKYMPILNHHEPLPWHPTRLLSRSQFVHYLHTFHWWYCLFTKCKFPPICRRYPNLPQLI